MSSSSAMSAADYLAGMGHNAAKAAARLSERASKALIEGSRAAGLDGQAHYFETSEEKLREIRKTLESTNDRDKLDGLQRLTAMVSKGRNVSEFFPNVVKNVASTNLQVRKLVYIYLLRYAEQEPDLALLSVNTFQKDLTDPSPIIRAMALRVMSGIRVPVICPIVLLGIKRLSTDFSPYVRRTAARAIGKCYSLAPELKEGLVEIIVEMLRDKSTLAIGSVVTAFGEVCPERLDLVHPHFRKLCHMLIDADEWGQLGIIDLLQKYARTQFLDPNRSSAPGDTAVGEPDLNPDLELLLFSCAPLLHSRNSAVVMAVASLFYYVAPRSVPENSPCDLRKVAKPLLRLLRTHGDAEYVVLTNIAGICQKDAHLFAEHARHFFVRYTDPPFIRTLKLEILTLIVTRANIGLILREFQDYIKSPDTDLSSSTIRCIGRVARLEHDVAENCLLGLVHLAWNPKAAIASEAVITLSTILDTLPETDKTAGVIQYLVHVLDSKDSAVAFNQDHPVDDEEEEEEEESEQAKSTATSVSKAKASLLALVSRNLGRLENIAPDVLRRGAVAFKAESPEVKMQVLALAAKLGITQPDSRPVQLLATYVFNLARYDLTYDIRDRARYLRALVFPTAEKTPPAGADGARIGAEEGLDGAGGWPTASPEETVLRDASAKIVMPERAASVYRNPSAGRSNYTLGTLSIVMDAAMPGYEPLPDWPTEQPDRSVREAYGNRRNEESGRQPPYFANSSQAASCGALGPVSAEVAVPSVRPRPKVNEDLEAFYAENGGESSEEGSSEEGSEETDSSEEEDGEEEEEEEETSDEEEDERQGRFFSEVEEARPAYAPASGGGQPPTAPLHHPQQLPPLPPLHDDDNPRWEEDVK